MKARGLKCLLCSRVARQMIQLSCRKGHPFQPDARMKALMNEGVAMGNATARALCFAPRDESARKYGAWVLTNLISRCCSFSGWGGSYGIWL